MLFTQGQQDSSFWFVAIVIGIIAFAWAAMRYLWSPKAPKFDADTDDERNYLELLQARTAEQIAASESIVDEEPKTPITDLGISLEDPSSERPTEPGRKKARMEPSPSRPQNPSSVDRLRKSKEALAKMKGACESIEEENLHDLLERGGTIVVDIEATLQNIGPTVTECLRDYLALQGEVALLAELFQVRPDLKTQEFCQEMTELYEWLLRDLARQDATLTTQLWTEAKTFLES